jgi:hypothetical protein
MRPGLRASSGLSTHNHYVADFLAVVGFVAFLLAFLGLIWALERV